LISASETGSTKGPERRTIDILYVPSGGRIKALLKEAMRKKTYVMLVALGCALLGSAQSAWAVVNGQPDPTLARHTVMVLDDHGAMCSGAVISRTAILTAAHCVTGAGAGAWRVHWRAPDSTPILVEPKSISVHPSFVRNAIGTRNRSVDLAIVTLAEPLPDLFEPIALSDVEAVTPGDTISVGGYGYAEEKNRKTLGTMRRADLSVVEPNGHSSILVWLSDPANSGAGGCQGDSGGPLIFQGALIAITFETTGLGKKNCGVLTQGILIAPQREWILRNVGR